MHKLAILMKLVTHLELVTKILKWFHEIWSCSGVDELLHFFIILVISVLENGSHSDWGCKGISPSNQKLIEQSQAKLKV